MSEEEWDRAAELLQSHYGRVDLEKYRRSWDGLVRFVLERSLSPKKFPKAWEAVKDTWCLSVEEMSTATRSEAQELLAPLGVSEKTVARLHRLARWWISQATDGSPFEQSSNVLEAEWEQLVVQDPQEISRIFITLGGIQRVLLTYAVQRVAGRHQWISWHDDGAEQLESLAAALKNSAFDLAQWTEWLIAVGDDYCAPRPKCQNCPLVSLLGDDGPCEPPADE